MDLNGLPADLAQFVQQEIAKGKFAPVEEVVSAALRMFQERDARGGNGRSASKISKAQRQETPAVPDERERTPDDLIRAIKQAFATDSPRLAERLAKEGAERYPEHAELQKYARVLAPPTVQVVPSTPESRAAAKADNAWLKAHWEEYRGNWIALQAGELLHATRSFDDLITHVGDVRGRSILVTKLN